MVGENNQLWLAQMRLFFTCTSKSTEYCFALVNWYQQVNPTNGLRSFKYYKKTEDWDVISLLDHKFTLVHIIPVFSHDDTYILNTSIHLDCNISI